MDMAASRGPNLALDVSRRVLRPEGELSGVYPHTHLMIEASRIPQPISKHHL